MVQLALPLAEPFIVSGVGIISSRTSLERTVCSEVLSQLVLSFLQAYWPRRVADTLAHSFSIPRNVISTENGLIAVLLRSNRLVFEDGAILYVSAVVDATCVLTASNVCQFGDSSHG